MIAPRAALPVLLATVAMACNAAEESLTVVDLLQDLPEFNGLAINCAQSEGDGLEPVVGELSVRFDIETSPEVCLSVALSDLGSGATELSDDEVVCIPELSQGGCPDEDLLGQTCIHNDRAIFHAEDLFPFSEISLVVLASGSGGSTQWAGRSTQPSSPPIAPQILGTYTLTDGACSAFSLVPTPE